MRATMVHEVESPFMVNPGSWMETPCAGAGAAAAAACSKESGAVRRQKPVAV
jgi:hypothetical protein